MYHSSYHFEFAALAVRVTQKLDDLEGVEYSELQPTFDTFAETMMFLHNNWDQKTFSTHLELLVRLVSWQLDNGHVASLTPFHILRLMGLHPLVNSEMLKKVSQGTLRVLSRKLEI